MNGRIVNKTLVKKLDKVFSLYIRKRDSKDGYFRCCSCSQIKPYEQADCGHFINRKHIATRWREDNCHGQCRSCNRFDEGNAVGYTLFMINKFGQPHVEYLNSLKNQTCRYTDFELEILIKEYKEKIK